MKRRDKPEYCPVLIKCVILRQVFAKSNFLNLNSSAGLVVSLDESGMGVRDDGRLDCALTRSKDRTGRIEWIVKSLEAVKVREGLMTKLPGIY